MFIVPKPRGEGHGFEFAQPGGDGAPGGGKMEGRPIDTIGYRGMHSYEIAFDDWFVPAENQIGLEDGLGRGFYYQMAGFENGRLQTAARAVGVMQAAYEEARQYAADRVVFGQPIADYQLTQAKLARMAVLIQAARQFAYEVARMMARGEGVLEASMVKAYVCKAAEWVTREAMQIHGGFGYAEEYPVSRYFVDARVLSIFEGADETLCLKVIARRLVDNLAELPHPSRHIQPPKRWSNVLGGRRGRSGGEIGREQLLVEQALRSAWGRRPRTSGTGAGPRGSTRCRPARWGRSGTAPSWPPGRGSPAPTAGVVDDVGLVGVARPRGAGRRRCPARGRAPRPPPPPPRPPRRRSACQWAQVRGHDRLWAAAQRRPPGPGRPEPSASRHWGVPTRKIVSSRWPWPRAPGPTSLRVCSVWWPGVGLVGHQVADGGGQHRQVGVDGHPAAQAAQVVVEARPGLVGHQLPVDVLAVGQPEQLVGALAEVLGQRSDDGRAAWPGDGLRLAPGHEPLAQRSGARQDLVEATVGVGELVGGPALGRTP